MIMMYWWHSSYCQCKFDLLVEFKFQTRLFEFHFALKPWEKHKTVFSPSPAIDEL